MKKKLLGTLLTLCMSISIITVFTAQAAAVDFKGTSLGDPSKAGEPTPTPTPATTNIDFKGSSLGDPSRSGEHTPKSSQDIIVMVNDKPIEFDVKPTIINDRTLVPLRAIFEALGAQVTWDGDTNTIYSSKGNSIIILQIDNKKAFVNSKEVTLDVAPQIIEDRTLVPTRFIAEALGADVQWDDSTSTVIIITSEMKTKHDTVKNSINNVR